MTGLRPDIISIFIGFGLGIAGTLFVERIKRSWHKKDQKEYAKHVLQAIYKEIEEGISRCKGLIDLLENNKISFSRVYTALWDSARLKISESIQDEEILRLLHRIYYRFDLINFNMERDKFSVGAAFAKEYIAEIEKNFNLLKSRIPS
ncbi:MAG: hypothetical protein AMJ91_08205 [candidate division Zixibacteria bacterium SM23_73_3]|nr:MAG: hypothetical protein AMJ91_08205 [candidate division Zixibacteria bacterium SM23_73_3]